jgi:thiol-disulfide isomerase/thioredoxin
MTDSTASSRPNTPPAPRRGIGAVLRALAPWVLVVVGGLWMLSNHRGRESMPAGEPVPALSVPLAGGGSFDLEAHRGKPVLLTFWASWCPACRAEAPAIQAAHERLEAAGGTAIGLAVDRRSIPAAQRLGMRFPQAVVAQEDLDRFGVELLPTTVLVDGEGRVAASFVGEVRSSTLNEALEPLLVQ